MNIYKLSDRESAWRVLSEADFSASTRKRFPFYQQNHHGEDMHYAVCPECNNPIQIIGLYKKMAHTDAPYGKHCSKPVSGFPHFSPEAIRFCALAQPRPRTLYKTKLRGFDAKAMHILGLLSEYFDQVAYIFKQFSGIHMTQGLARTMLRQYGRDGCLYEGATPQNVPWIFAYMADHQSLFNRQIEDVQLQKVILDACPTVYFDKNLLKTKKFTTIGLWFTNHRQKISPYGLQETFEMVVSVEKKDIFRKKIEFDHDFFQRLMNMPTEKRRNYATYKKLVVEELSFISTMKVNL